jgi:3-phosphoshikimate 1-carboxyvinyltransferase
MRIVVNPVRRIRGELRVPGDKSISHRALIIGALADGPVPIENLSPAHDVQSTALCLRELGVTVTAQGVHSCGLRPPARPLDAGNSGTTLRLLAGLLAGYPYTVTLTGDASLRKRPMQRIIEPLTAMGAQIESAGGYAPLRISGGRLRGIRYTLPIASSQVKSALVLAGLHAQGVTTVIEPSPTRDHTERMLRYLGVPLKTRKGSVSVHGGSRPKAKALVVPGDFSSAAFFLAAAVLVPEARLTIRDVGLNPTRTGFLDVLCEMGAQISVHHEREIAHEPWGDLRGESSELHGRVIGGALIPRLIDELPLLAICATQAHGVTVIQDAGELRVKETDRIRAVTHNLRKMGAHVEERPDGWVIPGRQRLSGALVESFGDHRIAMAFAIAGLIADGPTVISGAEWVAISYPSFFDDLAQLVHL